MRIARNLYEIVRPFMWVFVALWAVMLFSSLVNAPRSAAEQRRLQVDALADENRTYCGRWGFTEHTHAFNLCTLDLDEVRQHERERLTAIGF